MSPELLGLIEALDAVKEFAGTKSEEGERLRAKYEDRMDALLERHPNLSRQLAQSMIDLAYSRWQKAQQKPASIPPRKLIFSAAIPHTSFKGGAAIPDTISKKAKTSIFIFFSGQNNQPKLRKIGDNYIRNREGNHRTA